MLRNRGDGTFEDVTQASGLNRNNTRFSFAASWADSDADGRPDLYVANDFGRNNLYRKNADGTFIDVAARLGVEDVGAGMSASWFDYDRDGRLDLYVGNMWSVAGLRVSSQTAFQQTISGDVRDRLMNAKQEGRAVRNRSSIERARSTSQFGWMPTRAPSPRRGFSLDIPFYRTCRQGRIWPGGMSGGRAAAEGSIESESSPKMFASDPGLGYPTSAGTAKTEILVAREACEGGWKYFLNERLKAFLEQRSTGRR